MRQADPLTRGIEFAKGNRRLASDPLFEASNRDHNHDRSLVFHSGVGFDAHRKVAPAIGAVPVCSPQSLTSQRISASRPASMPSHFSNLMDGSVESSSETGICLTRAIAFASRAWFGSACAVASIVKHSTLASSFVMLSLIRKFLRSPVPYVSRAIRAE